MEFATRILNLTSLVIIIITGGYVHTKFGMFLSVETLLFLWFFVGVFGLFQLIQEYKKRRENLVNS